MTQSLDPQQRETLAGLAAVLAPGGESIPASTDIELEHRPIDRALSARPDLVQPLATLLNQAASRDAAEAVADLERNQPDQFDLLLEAVLGAYCLTEEVWDRLGYSGQEAIPLPRAGFGSEELVAAMMNSPERFRRPTDFSGGGP